MFEVFGTPRFVMPAKAGIHAFLFGRAEQGVDGRVKRDHDGVGALAARFVMPAKAGIHAFLLGRAEQGVDGRVKRDHDGVRAVRGHA